MAWRAYPGRNTGNKYKNKKITIDGLTFDSKREAKRYQELRLLEKAGAIRDLRTQVKFVLIPAQREPDIIGPKGGKKPGKLLERECAYIADFVYRDTATDKTEVEDTKGMRTKDYIIKRKLMLERYKIRIREI